LSILITNPSPALKFEHGVLTKFKVRKMDQDTLHSLAGILTVGGALCQATGILLFNPELLFGGTLIVVSGAIITICMLERDRLQP